MDKAVTLSNGCEAHQNPRKSTIQFLLNYSKALKVIDLKGGMQVEMIGN